MSFKPVIGIFVSNEKELKNLLDSYPYKSDVILSNRISFNIRIIEFEHYDLKIFYSVNQSARGYRFSNVIVSQSIMKFIEDSNTKDDYIGILYNFINPYNYYGANVNVVDLNF